MTINTTVDGSAVQEYISSALVDVHFFCNGGGAMG
jgi:hypothetical protein